MNKSDIWYGFLQAGEQSSPVVRDSSLETKNPKTLYLYNYVRGTFLEYSREIVEPKLREGTPEEMSLKELQKVFKAARKTFAPNNKSAKQWETPAPAAAKDVDLAPEDDFPADEFAEEY